MYDSIYLNQKKTEIIYGDRSQKGVTSKGVKWELVEKSHEGTFWSDINNCQILSSMVVYHLSKAGFDTQAL